MLVEGMSVTEINTAIFRDVSIFLNSSTQKRIEHDYMEMRKKMKIDRWDHYPVFTTIKSKTKNNWILITERGHDVKSVKSTNNITTSFITYYHTPTGYRVFVPCQDNDLLVYNGHLFTRYRERMHLIDDDPLTIIKLFFSNNFNKLIKEFDKDDNGEFPFVSYEKEGYLLGKVQELPCKTKWYVHKTFIPISTATLQHIDTANNIKYETAKALLNFKLKNTEELSFQSKECCHMYGFLDKEITVDFLKLLIADMEMH